MVLIFKFDCLLLVHRKAIDFCVLDLYLGTFLYFLHRQPCYLWTKSVLFLPSWSVYFFFTFLVLLHQLSLPVQCWVEMVREDTLTLFPTSEEKHSHLTVTHVYCRLVHLSFVKLKDRLLTSLIFSIDSLFSLHWFLCSFFIISFLPPSLDSICFFF